MKIGLFFLLLLSIILLSTVGCNSTVGKSVEVRLTLRSGANKKVLLERIGFGNEQPVIVDSIIIIDGNKEVVLHIPPGEQRLFQLRVPDSDVQCIFINDAPEILIEGNYINGSFKVSGSEATAILKNFTAQQKQLAQSNYMLQQTINSIVKNDPLNKQIDSLKNKLNSARSYFFKRYILFADTVQSPALFMAVYNNIDFGKDFKSLGAFIDRASARFPDYHAIQDLKKDIMAIIKIFDEEYNIGDQLPYIYLPDKNGIYFSTATLKGKFYFIDFWSTWCPQCMVYNTFKKKAYLQFPKEKFAIVSVAIDAEKDQWQEIISKQAFAWPQLIDENMWKGTAVKILKFDSIPFNFLVSPTGRIINKAIKPDSLLAVISSAINGSGK